MRRIGRIVLGCLGALTLFCASQNCFSQNIEGNYDLYRSEDASKVVATMIIHDQSGNQFLVTGIGWSGKGQMNGNTGYYDWTFSDGPSAGKSGRTTLALRDDGSLEGHVIGPPGDNGLNWTYIARRRAKN